MTADSVIDEATARESDLLAFQIAIERGQPGSVMCSYNLVNGVHGCHDPWLLTKVLKDDTHFRAFGADQIARCIVQGIRDQKLPIAADIREDVPTFDPSKPNDPAKYDLPESKPSQIVKPEGS